MTTAKKLLAVVLSLILIAGPILITVSAIDTKVELPESKLIQMIKEFFEKLKQKIKELLAKLGFGGPGEEPIFEPRVWPDEDRSQYANAGLVNEFLTLVNNAKADESAFTLDRNVHTSYKVVKTVGGDMTASIINGILVNRFPTHVGAQYKNPTDGLNITSCIEPFGVDAFIDVTNVKSGIRTVNPDNTATIKLTLFSETYAETSSVHSAMTSYCLGKADFNSSMFRAEEFQAYVSGATFSITFDLHGNLISQEYNIPVSYDVAGSYIVGEEGVSGKENETTATSATTNTTEGTTKASVRGRGFVSVDTLTRIVYSYAR